MRAASAPGQAGDETPDAGTVLVVAKAPVPGIAKTRLAKSIGPVPAADLAAAALLDTLAAARGSGARVVVALTGDLSAAARRTEVEAALAATTVIPQRGDGLGERLALAHSDAHAHAASHPSAGHVAGAVFQVGMDTPQLTAALLVEALAAARRHQAVLGPATDGGWWGLAVASPGWAQVLSAVPMSSAATGAATLEALEARGVPVHLLAELRDVDEWADARAVAGLAPAGRFAAAVAQVTAAICAPDGSEHRT